MREAGAKGPRTDEDAFARTAHHAGVARHRNIQAIVGRQLDSGEMAVVHIDKAGDIVVDGKITVP